MTINIHLNRMEAAISRCRMALPHSPSSEEDCNILGALALDTIKEIAALAEALTDEPLRVDAAGIVEEIANHFMDVADRAERDREESGSVSSHEDSTSDRTTQGLSTPVANARF